MYHLEKNPVGAHVRLMPRCERAVSAIVSVGFLSVWHHDYRGMLPTRQVRRHARSKECADHYRPGYF